MAEEVRIWEIQEGDKLKELTRAKLDLEARLETWLEKDISLVKDLLIIGRQVGTDYGDAIDLLCLDSNGDVVIVELKRDKTPREVVAQTLDYASWVRDLSYERITEIANEYLGNEGPLGTAFSRKFQTELPETLNEHHKMMIVASYIDGRSERIIRYLSESYGVSINAAKFQYFRNERGSEFLARVFLIDPGQVEDRTKDLAKRKPRLTYEQLQEIAEQNGVADIYQRLCDGLVTYFKKYTTQSSLGFDWTFEDGRKSMMSLIPQESSAERGLRYRVYTSRFSAFLGIPEELATSIFPEKEKWEYFKNAPPEWSGHAGYFKSVEEAEAFLSRFSEWAKNRTG